MHSSTQHMAPPTHLMRQEEWAVASTMPWDLLPGLNHCRTGVGGEDHAPPKLTTGTELKDQLFPGKPTLGACILAQLLGSPHSFPGNVVGKAKLLPVSPYLHPSFPKSGCAQKQIIQLLRMQPRHLSQPEHLIFYRLKCMQIGPSPREHPQGSRGWEQGSESGG